MEIRFFSFHQRAAVSACNSGERSELVQSYGKKLSFTSCKVVAKEISANVLLFSGELS